MLDGPDRAQGRGRTVTPKGPLAADVVLSRCSTGKKAMPQPIEISVYVNDEQAYQAQFAAPLELGRQQNGESGPFHRRASNGGERLVIAPINEVGVSRSHVLLSPDGHGSVCVTNLSANSPVALKLEIGGGTITLLAMGEERKVRPPVELGVGKVRVLLGRAGEPSGELHTLAVSSKAPGQAAADVAVSSLAASLGASIGAGVEVQPFIAWLRVALEVLQSAAGAPDFLERAAQATANLVKLDSAGVLLRDGTQSFKIAALNKHEGARDWRPSRNMLSTVCGERRTCWMNAQEMSNPSLSLEGVASVVAAPILDPNGNVIGVLYGDRRRYDQLPLSQLEAQLVELLASGIAAGLARKEQQENHIRLQQFFPANLVTLIENNSDLLNGRDAEVTVMVCDIYGFSAMAERLGPSRTVEWVRDVMNLLSDAVIEQEGVLVDYVGDELMAMWGAPIRQPDDAQRACRAVLQARRLLAELSRRWQAELGQETIVGIGVNTGPAYVGNVGSARKFKYGPLGNTVNVASRTQGASKYLRCFSLITGDVQARLDSSFATRRLCQARMKNIAEPVTLYELADDPSPVWRELKETYEEALRCFEAADFHRAAKLLGVALEGSARDGPSMELLRRVVTGMNQGGESFDPVWRFADK